MSTLRSVYLAWLFSLFSWLAAEEQGEKVGSRSEIRNLRFSGNATFDSRELQNALLQDADFLVASHPLAPLNRCLQVLESKIQRGYRADGFPEVKVKASAGESIEVQIDEGVRVMAGDVRFVNARTVPVEALLQSLTQSYPTKEQLTPAVAQIVIPQELEKWREDFRC